MLQVLIDETDGFFGHAFVCFANAGLREVQLIVFAQPIQDDWVEFDGIDVTMMQQRHESSEYRLVLSVWTTYE